MSKSEKQSVQKGKYGKGGTPTPISPGRKKGVPNKITTDVKKMILEALDNAGGVDYLVRQATANPNAFMALVGKVLPMTVQGDANAPLTIKIIKGLGDNAE